MNSYVLAPGIEVRWENGPSYRELIQAFDTQGGEIGWRPHFPGDVQRILYELGADVYDDSGKILSNLDIPPYNESMGDYALYIFPESKEELEKDLSRRKDWLI